jgi:hypothetical protein
MLNPLCDYLFYEIAFKSDFITFFDYKNAKKIVFSSKELRKSIK